MKRIEVRDTQGVGLAEIVVGVNLIIIKQGGRDWFWPPEMLAKYRDALDEALLLVGYQGSESEPAQGPGSPAGFTRFLKDVLAEFENAVAIARTENILEHNVASQGSDEVAWPALFALRRILSNETARDCRSGPTPDGEQDKAIRKMIERETAVIRTFCSELLQHTWQPTLDSDEILLKADGLIEAAQNIKEEALP